MHPEQAEGPHDDGPIPVILLTGFLGSGKTTLLNAELVSGAIPDTLVIINEFGEAGLDHTLVEQSSDTVELLEGGCACCSSMGDLRATLAHLGARRRLGTLPPFRRVVVETSGIADPLPLIETLCAPATHEAGFALSTVATVVDLPQGARNIADFPEARRQVAFADIVILSKLAGASRTDVEALCQRLGAINPQADIRSTGQKAGLLARPPAPRDRDLGQAAHGGAHTFRSVTVRRARPVAWPAFAAWVSAVTSLRGPSILRVKGLVRTAERDDPVIIQGVQAVLDAPRLMRGWPDRPGTTLTFITKQDRPGDFQQSFDAAIP